MRTDIEYDPDRPLMRLEKGDMAIISVVHFPDTIVRDKDKAEYGHIPKGEYPARVIRPYTLSCDRYPELGGRYNYWRGDKRGCSDGIYADEVKKIDDNERINN